MSRQHPHLYASLVGDVVTGPTTVKGDRLRSTFQMLIVNTMRESVFWRNAMGIMVSEMGILSPTAEEYLYIHLVYEFDPSVKIDARELLDELDLPDNHVERKDIYAALQRLERLPDWERQRTFSYTLGISRQRLEEAGGVVYLNDVDLVVGFDRHRHRTVHPYSPPGQRLRLTESLPEEEGLHMHYLLVDNAGIYGGSRWINTGQVVLELVPTRDPQMRDGVYISVRHQNGQDPVTHYHRVDEAEEELGLYRSRVEAESYGAPEKRFKQKLQEQEQELLREKAQLAKAKQDADREKHELERERQEEEARRKREEQELENDRRRLREESERHQETMRFEKERLDLQRETMREKQKFEFDMVSRDRKDQSEQLKAVLDTGKSLLALASLALSAYALFKKNAN